MLFLLSAADMSAQKRGKLNFENIYRPIYGYVLDSLTSQPCRNVTVYAFDSLDEAMVGKDALAAGKNPLKLKLKGDVVETNIDETGRYMLPVRNQGALLFHFREKGVVIIQEVAGRNNVSLGKREEEPEFDLSEYLGPDYKPTVIRYKKREPLAVDLDMRFNTYIKTLDKAATDSRVIVERRIVDVEDGHSLHIEIKVVRDGKNLHRQRKKLLAKGLLEDPLFDLAKDFPVLADSTYRIPVRDRFSTDPWKDRWFKLAYVIRLEDASGVRDLDTMYTYTNRVFKPLNYLETDFGPYMVAPEEYDEVKGLAVKRKLVLKGEYDGKVPETLMDSAYILKELHVKAVVRPEKTYEENIALADSLSKEAMKELRTVFADKLDKETRVITVSEIGPDTLDRNRVEYRYVFNTARRFSRNEYVRLFADAENDEELERVCRRALEESVILENQSWDYASNVLAAVLIRKGEPDPDLLVPFVDTTFRECDMIYDDPVLYRPVVKNRRETVANQVIMLMMSGRHEDAADLAAILPERYAFLRELAWCRAGNNPENKRSVELIRASSLRNRVVMDMYSNEITEKTMAVFDEMSEDDAMMWYLKACCICILADDDLSKMGQAYDCLRKSFSIDPKMKSPAVMEAGINDVVLKDVLGVQVL